MYKVLGTDGRQYGPVGGDQLRIWIAEKRANAQTQVLAEGATEWKALGTLPEFAALFNPSIPPSIAPVSASVGGYGRVTNSYALWGMIFGILSLVGCMCCCLNFIFGPLGLVFSLIGLSEISQNPERYEGRSLAIVGIVLSALGLLFGIALMFSGAINGNFHHHHYPYGVPVFPR